MILNRIKKLIVITLCALFVLPLLNLSSNNVNAAGYDHEETIYVGLEYAYKISKEDIKNAKLGDITISAKKDSEAEFKTIYDGSATDRDVKDDGIKVSFSTGNSSLDAKVSIVLRDVAVYEIKVEVKEKTTTHLSKLTVTDEYSREKLTPSYINLDKDNETYKDYLTKVGSATKKNGAQLLAGDEYTIPKLDVLVKSLVPYENLKKTLYYATPNGTSYTTKTFTKADGTFSISVYGTYRFYVTLYVEKYDKYEDGILLGTEGLEEKNDGFYQISDKDGKKLYAKKANNEWEYVYKDGEEETPYEGLKEETTAQIIIPIFSFTLENKGPSIKVSNSYQENGYIDLLYTLSGVTINGNDVQTEYTLEYKEEGAPATAWATAEEEFDSEALSFTPTKLGSYRVVIKAIDATGISTSKETLEIVVKEKYQKISHRTSFADWISVNYLPFIFLCISGVCLIAIILLLVINPKEKVSTVKEEDR